MFQQDSLPAVVRFLDDSDINPHWHSCHELIYILSGQLCINYKNSIYYLAENDVILINMFDFHYVQPGSGAAVSLLLNSELLGAYALPFQSAFFDCNSATAENKNNYTALKRAIVELIQTYHTDTPFAVFYNAALTNQIVYELLINFKIESIQSVKSKAEKNEHIKAALFYINEHYRKKITLKEAAARSNCSPNYFSWLLKNYLGTSFSEYVTDVRITNAVNDLIHTGHSINYIAQQHGFSNTASFVKSFKQRYNMLPSHYRKEQSLRAPVIGPDTNSLPEYINEFSKKSEVFTAKTMPAIKKIELKPIDVTGNIKALKHSFKEIFPYCPAQSILYSDTQRQIRHFQEQVNFQYIFLKHFFREPLGIYTEISSKEIYNFSKVDVIIDFLVSIGLKPIIDLGSLPKEIEETENSVNFNGYGMGIIAHAEKWKNLVTHTLQHFIGRYGAKEIQGWKFIPAYIYRYSPNPEDSKNYADYYKIYQNAYNLLKSFQLSLQVGSLLFYYTDFSETDSWFSCFSEYCNSHSCEPDFISFVYYPYEHNTVSGNILHIEHSTENHLDAYILKIKKLQKKAGWSKKRLYLMEWGATRCKYEPLNDTVFNASFIASTLLVNYDALDSFCYSGFLDSPINQNQASYNFYGDVGLLTQNGIKKAAYKVFPLISQLGSQLIFQSPGVFVTREENTVKGILYHYQPPAYFTASNIILDAEHGLVSVSEKNEPDSLSSRFPDQVSVKFEVPFVNLSETAYYLIEHILNDQNGCPFEKWNESGAYPFFHSQDIAYLNNISELKILRKKIEPQSGVFQYTREIKPNEIRYFELIPIDATHINKVF